MSSEADIDELFFGSSEPTFLSSNPPRLQIHPKLRAVAKVSGKPERRIRTNRPLSIQDRRNPPRRYA